MSKMSVDRAHKIIQGNISTIYHMPERYKALNHYLSFKGIRETLLGILSFFKNSKIIIYKHKYIVYLDYTNMAARVFKGKKTRSSLNQYVNILCAIGLMIKLKPDIDLEINKRFIAETGRRRMINTFCLRPYTDRELERFEIRSQRLLDKNIRIKHISYNTLMLNGLADIAQEVYPCNAPEAPTRKLSEETLLIDCIESLIDAYGYADRESIKTNLAELPDREIERLLGIFRNEHQEKYFFKRPTKEQKNLFGLSSYSFIYTRK